MHPRARHRRVDTTSVVCCDTGMSETVECLFMKLVALVLLTLVVALLAMPLFFYLLFTWFRFWFG